LEDGNDYRSLAVPAALPKTKTYKRSVKTITPSDDSSCPTKVFGRKIVYVVPPKKLYLRGGNDGNATPGGGKISFQHIYVNTRSIKIRIDFTCPSIDFVHDGL
jgi:hypothetical protein